MGPTTVGKWEVVWGPFAGSLVRDAGCDWVRWIVQLVPSQTYKGILVSQTGGAVIHVLVEVTFP